jgi:hypothetical protein
VKDERVRGERERIIRQGRIETVKRMLASGRSIEWTTEQIAETVGLSVRALMKLMESPDFVLENPKPLFIG